MARKGALCTFENMVTVHQNFRPSPSPSYSTCASDSPAPKDIPLAFIGLVLLFIGLTDIVKALLILLRCPAESPSPMPPPPMPNVPAHSANTSPDQRCTGLAADIAARNENVGRYIQIQERELEQLSVESHPLPVYASKAIQYGVLILLLAYAAHLNGLVDLSAVSAVSAFAFIIFDPNFLLVLIAVSLVYNRLICTTSSARSAMAPKRVVSMLSFFVVGLEFLFGGYGLCLCALAAESYGTGWWWIVSCPHVTPYIASVCAVLILIATSMALYHS